MHLSLSSSKKREREMATKSMEISTCNYPKEAALITPSSPTPRHTLYLSNLDDQPFLRFTIGYIYLYKEGISVEALKASLSRVLVDYYPLAGRLRAAGGGGDGDGDGEGKLEVDCNGEGALFGEGFVDLSVEGFLEGSRRPDSSWRKLLCRDEGHGCFLGVPPLVVQVIHLTCGGMILCTVMNHCVIDGIGSAQFLQAWAQITKTPGCGLSIDPFHNRHMLKPRTPLKITFPHPEFDAPSSREKNPMLFEFLQSQPLAPVSATFTPSQILCLKKLCVPSFKCTSFEVLASHVWRAWVKSLDLPASLDVKLLFSVNARKKLNPELPKGFYGNGFVLGCAKTSVNQVMASNLHNTVKLIQQAKERIGDSYIRSVIDLLEERRIKPDLSASLVISQWSKLGLEDLDFGEGRPVHMGPLTSEIYCLFLPVIGDLHSFTVLMSVPQGIAEKFEHLLKAV